MTNQAELIAQMGENLRNLHADKYDEKKDAKYWQDFALAMRRREAEAIGWGDAFDDAVEEGTLAELLPRLGQQLTIRKLMDESKAARRVHFGIGLAVGFALASVIFQL